MVPTESNYTESIGLVYLLGASLLSITAQGNVWGGERMCMCTNYGRACQCEVSFKVTQVLSVPGVPVRDSM